MYMVMFQQNMLYNVIVLSWQVICARCI